MVNAINLIGETTLKNNNVSPSTSITISPSTNIFCPRHSSHQYLLRSKLPINKQKLVFCAVQVLDGERSLLSVILLDDLQVSSNVGLETHDFIRLLQDELRHVLRPP